MKILAISNLDDFVDKIIDAFDGTDVSVVAKQDKSDLQGIVKQVSDAMAKGTYSYAILAADDHIGASVLLNKSKGIRAGVCESEADLDLAKENEVNVIILKASETDLEYLPKGIGAGSAPAVKKSAEPEPKKQQAQTKQQQAQPKKQEEPEEEPEEDQQEEDTGQQQGSGKGFMSKIKDSLGIVDK